MSSRHASLLWYLCCKMVRRLSTAGTGGSRKRVSWAVLVLAVLTLSRALRLTNQVMVAPKD